MVPDKSPGIFARHPLPFILLVIIAELTTSIGLVPQVAFSMSSAASFVTLLLFGSLPAALATMVGSILTTFMTEITIAGWVYVLLNGKVGEVALWSNLLLHVSAYPPAGSKSDRKTGQLRYCGVLSA